MKANRCPVWTPLYWHRRLLHEYVVRESSGFLDVLQKRFLRESLQILDAGCGSMPYRDAFTGLKSVTYVGADVPWAGNKPEVTIDAKSQRIGAPDASFHGLIHFQVLEHVPDYSVFLAECFRLLKPGGTMFCTVPFAFEFHAVPSDYRRWTHEGLKFDLEKCGFNVLKIEPVESDFLSVLSICELYLARKLGYVITKPLFLGMNALGFPGWPAGKGLIPLTNGVLCQKPT